MELQGKSKKKRKSIGIALVNPPPPGLFLSPSPRWIRLPSGAPPGESDPTPVLYRKRMVVER